jgi:hypothetical protein
MDEPLREKILELLDQYRIMTVATNRPDGWPQATTVGPDPLFPVQPAKPKGEESGAG